MRLRIVFGFVVVLLGLGTAVSAQNSVDLRSQQTGIRNQGNQNTCTHFAAIAAIEAAYLRRGIRVDLSESFARSAIKTMWLTRWTNVAAGTAAQTENQLAYAGGGTATETLKLLSSGIKVPTERDWPYRDRYTVNDDPRVANRWNAPFWQSQRTMNDFNLTSGIWPREALEAPRYYAGTGYTDISFANGVNAAIRQIEGQLAQKREVTGGFTNGNGVIRTAGSRDTILVDDCPGGCPPAGHAMLLVGYDKTDPNPANHYFIAKNSWGVSNGATRSDGFTYLTYAFMRGNLVNAGYITGVVEPKPWREAAFVGRWNIIFDGHRGVIDINKVPGVMTSITKSRDDLQDRRIGTYFDANGMAYRVNGAMSGNRIRFYIDKNNPNARYDTLTGRTFDYTLTEDASFASGQHRDPDGKIYGGYMWRDDVDAPQSPARVSGIDWQRAQGTWDVHTGADGPVSTVELRYDPAQGQPRILEGNVLYDTTMPRVRNQRSFVFARGQREIGMFHAMSWDANRAVGRIAYGPAATLVPAVFIKR
ncbi:C1 family peptidase [uncultured Tateyamaria sp.]|uniref:C1 family peptidase n=1 Tax=uncultured Tateyamaria sp. TaxID=455651 RepID=UPI00261D7DA1|nr:C1 family peptidase [uncultured Tateyamaria sp.]